MLLENIQVKEPKGLYSNLDLYNYNNLVGKVKEIEDRLNEIKKEEE